MVTAILEELLIQNMFLLGSVSISEILLNWQKTKDTKERGEAYLSPP